MEENGEQDLISKYVEAIIKELEYKVTKYSFYDYDTVYIGGGNPGLLSSSNIALLCRAIKRYSKCIKEWSLEINPENVEVDKVRRLKECGVNRLSLGVQSLNEASLASVNRRATKDTVLNALKIIKDNWGFPFNVDFISGLPLENKESFSQGLNQVLKFTPSHLSLYPLTLEEGVPLMNKVKSGVIKLPDSEEQYRIWREGKRVLKENGYAQYEVSSFYKRRIGSPCLHNLTYWRLNSYLGIGAGATGSLYLKKFNKESFRYTNTKDLFSYLKTYGDSPSYRASLISKIDDKKGVATEIQERLDRKTLEKEFFMLGLRLSSGITSKDFYNLFSSPIPESILSLFSKWQETRDIKVTRGKHFDRYNLTCKGLLFYNRFIREIFITLNKT